LLLRFAAATHQRYSRLIQSECAGVATRISVCVRSQRRSLHESKPLQRPRRSESCVTRSLCAGRGRRCRAAPKSLRVGSAITSALAADLPLRSPAHQFHHRPGARGSGIQRLEFTTTPALAAAESSASSSPPRWRTRLNARLRSPWAWVRTPPNEHGSEVPARRVHHSASSTRLTCGSELLRISSTTASGALCKRVQRVGFTTARAIR